MADRFITAHLRRLPLFAQLTDEQVVQLAEATEVIQRDPGTLLLQQGAPTQG